MQVLQLPENYESTKEKLKSGAIVGHTTDRSARIWCRVFKEGDWSLIVSDKKLDIDPYNLAHANLADLKNATPSIVFLQEQHISNDTDQTAVFDVTGLRADTRYYYYLASDKLDLERWIECGSQHQYWFHTQPEAPTSLCFGFYSCHDPFSVKPASEGAWDQFRDVLENRKAHFVIGGGDQVYCDTNHKSRIEDVWVWLKNNKNALLAKYRNADETLQEDAIIGYFTSLYRTYYRVYWQFGALQEVFRRFPQYMIWDDHEIMDGWGSLTKAEREKKLSNFFQDDDESANYQLVMLMFKAASAAYYEYQHSHNPHTGAIPEDPNNSQWDYSFAQGDYGFFMLDVRGHHDCEAPEGQRLLGAEQFERFKNWITSDIVRQKQALFVCSPVPVVHWNESVVNWADFGGQKDDFMDEWGHETNHKERDAMLELMFRFSHETGIPVVILSGDVHCASAFRITDGDNYPKADLFNVTSSAISREPAPKFATMAFQKSGPMNKDDDTDNRAFEQLYRFAGENNFALVNANHRDGSLDLSVTLYWVASGSEEATQKTIWLKR